MTSASTSVWILILLLLTSLVGLTSILLLSVFLVTWRRRLRTQAGERRKRPAPDVWQASGDRLISKIDNLIHDPDSPFRPGGSNIKNLSGEFPGIDPDDDDDDDDDDDPADDWKRGQPTG